MNQIHKSTPAIFLFLIVSFAHFMPATAQNPDKRPTPSEGGKSGPKGGGPKITKPKIEDAVKAAIYADNWFKLYINGNLVAVDSISFIPHNVVAVEILPEYPMTIAVIAKDNADPDTGLEYDNTNLGDGGFILKFSDGTVTNATWRAKSFFHGPVDRNMENPKTIYTPIPTDWFSVGFDDSGWSRATEHSQEEVDQKAPFFEHDFDGAKWIWTEDLALDNTIIFRTRIPTPPNGSPLPSAWPRGEVYASEKSKP